MTQDDDYSELSKRYTKNLAAAMNKTALYYDNYSSTGEEHMKFKEEWLFPNAVVPVDAETTQAMVEQIKRMMDIIGGMALTQKNAWVGLTDEEIEPLCNQWRIVFGSWTYDFAKAIEAKLKEKNT